MDTLERRNLSEIEGLNQRGGRTLSFVDLVRAGTMTPELVAHCWTAIAGGASFLTAARPGGAGKSTVLANLLILLPPGEEIWTVTEGAGASGDGPRCALAHEIGAGRYHGYIWGAEVGEFLGLARRGHRVASCLHADTLEEVREILVTPPLSLPEADLGLVDLLLFVHVTPAGRRVAAVWDAVDSGHHQAFRWGGAREGLVRTGPSPLLEARGAGEAEYQRKLEAVRRILDRGDARLEAVREQVVEAYRV